MVIYADCNLTCSLILYNVQIPSLHHSPTRTLQVEWAAGDADAVVLTRLKNASVIHGLHEERVVIQLSIARADIPGAAVSAASFGTDEEVHARLAVHLLPPQACSPQSPHFSKIPIHALISLEC